MYVNKKKLKIFICGNNNSLTNIIKIYIMLKANQFISSGGGLWKELTNQIIEKEVKSTDFSLEWKQTL